MEDTEGSNFIALHLDQIVAYFRLVRVKIPSFQKDLLLFSNDAFESPHPIQDISVTHS